MVWYLYYIAAVYIAAVYIMLGIYKELSIGVILKGFIIATLFAFPFLIIGYRMYLKVMDWLHNNTTM